MRKLYPISIFFGVFLLGTISRAPTVMLGALLPIIKQDLNIPYWASGFIVTLPVIILSLASIPLSRILAAKGVIFTLTLGLFLYALSLLIRSFGGLPGLFIGSAMVGLGMCFINIIVPIIIKNYYSQQTLLVSSFYTTVMFIFAAISSAFAVPLAKLTSSWEISLAMYLPLIVLSIFMWLRQKDTYKEEMINAPKSSKSVFRLIRKSSLARWITVLMACQSFIYYGSIAWLPTIVQAAGYTGTEAGFLASIVQICGIPGAIITGLVAYKFSTLQIPCMLVGGLFFLSSIFMAFSTSMAGFVICSTMLGLSLASSYTLFLSILSLRTRDSAQASELVGIVFTIGYLMASLSPVIMGGIYDLTQTWLIPIMVLVLSSFIYILAGYNAGKDGVV